MVKGRETLSLSVRRQALEASAIEPSFGAFNARFLPLSRFSR
jgi:hypothetical protein